VAPPRTTRKDHPCVAERRASFGELVMQDSSPFREFLGFEQGRRDKGKCNRQQIIIVFCACLAMMSSTLSVFSLKEFR
jgi:hypothetical protein